MRDRHPRRGLLGDFDAVVAPAQPGQSPGENQHEPVGSGVDDPGLGEHVELIGRLGDRLVAGGDHHFDDLGQDQVLALTGHVLGEPALVVLEPGEMGRGRVSHRPDHGQHRPLGRIADRLVGSVGGAREGGRDQGRVDQLAGTGRELLRGPPHDLTENHAGVAAGAHQRRPGDRVDDVVAVRRLAALGLDPVELGKDRPHRQRHVVARVAVGNREDVQVIDFLAPGLELAVGSFDDAPEALDRGIRGHGAAK